MWLLWGLEAHLHLGRDSSVSLVRRRKRTVVEHRYRSKQQTMRQFTNRTGHRIASETAALDSVSWGKVQKQPSQARQEAASTKKAQVWGHSHCTAWTLLLGHGRWMELSGPRLSKAQTACVRGAGEHHESSSNFTANVTLTAWPSAGPLGILDNSLSHCVPAPPSIDAGNDNSAFSSEYFPMISLSRKPEF